MDIPSVRVLIPYVCVWTEQFNSQWQSESVRVCVCVRMYVCMRESVK